MEEFLTNKIRDCRKECFDHQHKGKQIGSIALSIILLGFHQIETVVQLNVCTEFQTTSPQSY